MNLRASDHPEFDAWRWNEYWVPLEWVIEFKREVYQMALTELAGSCRAATTTTATCGRACAQHRDDGPRCCAARRGADEPPPLHAGPVEPDEGDHPQAPAPGRPET